MNEGKYQTRLLFVSTSYPQDQNDWRGTFIANMVGSIAGDPNRSLSLWAPGGKKPKVVESVSSEKESRWLGDLMEAGGIASVYRQGGISAIYRVLQLLYHLHTMYSRETPRSDVIHVNWLQNTLSLGGDSVPLLVTVLGADMKLLELPGMVFMLRRVFKKRPCIIAPNAEWMTKPLQRFFSDVATIRPILFGIDESWYQLYLVRHYKHWGTEKKKFIVVLRITTEKIGKLFEWGEGIFGENRHDIHLFGPMQGSVKIPDWVQYHGPANPDELRRNWFRNAAGLISLSQHDEGRPQVMLEAMAAGLPIIASDIPAHRDLLVHKETGLICEDQQQFINAVRQLSVKESNERLSQNAHKWIKGKVGTWECCADRYGQAYADLMGVTH